MCGEARVVCDGLEEWPCEIHVQSGSNQGPAREAWGACRGPAGVWLMGEKTEMHFRCRAHVTQAVRQPWRGGATVAASLWPRPFGLWDSDLIVTLCTPLDVVGFFKHPALLGSEKHSVLWNLLASRILFKCAQPLRFQELPTMTECPCLCFPRLLPQVTMAIIFEQPLHSTF